MKTNIVSFSDVVAFNSLSPSLHVECFDLVMKHKTNSKDVSIKFILDEMNAIPNSYFVWLAKQEPKFFDQLYGSVPPPFSQTIQLFGKNVEKHAVNFSNKEYLQDKSAEELRRICVILSIMKGDGQYKINSESYRDELLQSIASAEKALSLFDSYSYKNLETAVSQINNPPCTISPKP